MFTLYVLCKQGNIYHSIRLNKLNCITFTLSIFYFVNGVSKLKSLNIDIVFYSSIKYVWTKHYVGNVTFKTTSNFWIRFSYLDTSKN